MQWVIVLASILSSANQDVRFALRAFRKNPGFTFAALLTLALGIGANTAIFSVIDAALLHPIPFPEPDRLTILRQRTAHQDDSSVSYPNLLDWQQRTQTFEGIAGVRQSSFTLSGHGDPEQLSALTVSWNLLSVLRAQPLLGRMFTKEEDRRHAAPVVLLGEPYWRRRFAADSKIVGQALRLNGRDYTVIGIVPARVARLRLNNDPGGFTPADVLTPIGQNDTDLFNSRGVGDNTTGLGRLKAGVTLVQAGVEMDAVMRNLGAEYAEDADMGARTSSFREDLAGNLEPVLLALGAAVGFVLLIACTNVANLVLARSAGRTQEFGIRIALGAGPGRLVRQLLTESLLLSLAGGALGLLIASWCTDQALAALPSVLPATADVQINDRVLWFTFAVSLLTGVLFGVAPALKAGAVSIQETLRQGGRGVLTARRRPQYVLIVSEVALTLILLVGTGLMIRTLHNLWSVAPGFEPQNLLVFYSGLSPDRTSSPEKARAAIHEINDRLRALPGVQAAAVETGGLPFFGNTGFTFSREDEPKTSKSAMRVTNIYWVSPDHFKVMGIPLLRGRSFTDQDTEKSPFVAVIDEDSARALFPSQIPIGKYLRLQLYDHPVEIVGIAGRVKQIRLDPDAAANRFAQIYSPFDQIPESILPLMADGFAGLVRSSAEPAALLRAVRKEVNAFDSGAVSGERWMTDAIAGSLAPRRFSLIVLAAFAAVALILSIVGIYGVVSYLISQRTNEIGVRMTLGARPRDIFLGVLREGAMVGAIGIAIGLVGAAALTRLMASMLFGVNPRDFLTTICAAVLLFGCTILACYWPARRAVRVDPATALRAGG
jgi:predicted permease